MLRIREIAEDELEELVSVALEAQPREHATAAGFVDWRNQAGDMVWLLAERDDETVGAGYALVGWHTPPYRAIGAAFVPHDERGAGVGIARPRRTRGLGRRARRAQSSKVPSRRTTTAAWPGLHATATTRAAGTPASYLDLTSAEIADRRRRRGSRS